MGVRRRLLTGLVLLLGTTVLVGGASWGVGADSFRYPVVYLGHDDRLASALRLAGAIIDDQPAVDARAVIFDDCEGARAGQEFLVRGLVVAAVRCNAVDLLDVLEGPEAMVRPWLPTLVAEGLITQSQVAETQAALVAQTAAQAQQVAESKPGLGASIRSTVRIDPTTGRVSHYLGIGPFGGSVKEMVMQINLDLEDPWARPPQRRN